MYRKRARGWLKHIDFWCIDLVCFQLAFMISYVMRHGYVNPYGLLLYRNTAIIAVFVEIFTFLFFNTFHNVLRRGYYREFINTLKTTMIVMMIIVFYLFTIRQGGTYSRIVLIANTGYYWALIYLFRNIWKYILREQARRNVGRCSMVLITTREQVRKTLTKLIERNVNEYQILGVILLDRKEMFGEICGVPVVANRDTAAEYLCRGWVDEVFIDVIPQKDMAGSLEEIMQVIPQMNIVAHLRIDIPEEFHGQKRELQRIGDYAVLTMSANTLSIRDALMKRLLDIIGGLVGCMLAVLLTVILGPVIYLKSPGNIFFSQVRVGRNGKRFKIYKFRSMKRNADALKAELAGQNEVEDGMMFKIANDPRIIGSEKGPGKGIGNFIRKYSIDEFPQFFNILKGDMSLVGTRPPTEDEWEKYDYHHRSRMSIKPGLTGMWQVSGRSDIKDFEEVVALDKQYIEEWSFGLDLKILLKTIWAVFQKEGAR